MAIGEVDATTGYYRMFRNAYLPDAVPSSLLCHYASVMHQPKPISNLNNRYLIKQFNLFVDPVTNDEQLHGYFQQDGRTMNIASSTVSEVQDY
ncbi:hypothetical protein NPIL_61811 [Nephila pilipes]|uniref:Uncharacterized protein n=1 Tax=Nephila pilipes TaxID=299642 RepID=A0A8X6UQ21_NEPPI|nr:hypothetical protein NPIL_61811 [Nephila pilipes]